MKKIYWILIVIACIYLLTYVTHTTYIYKTLIYNYVNIDDYKIFYNNTIKAGKGTGWPISKRYNQQKMSGHLRNTLEEIKTIAFLVVKSDSIIHEQYWNGYSDSTLSNSFSAAKSVVSILTGIALQEGYFKSVDQSIGDFVPEYKEGKKARITIKHLLTMTSGLNFQESYGSPISHTTEAYYGKDLPHLINRLEVIHEPGTVHDYQSGNTELLGMAIRNATGKSLAEYTSEKLWKPIGAEQDALWSTDVENGIEKAYCCINSNARDFARIGQLYLNKGSWSGQQIVDSTFVEASLQPIDLESGIIDYYGYSWWLLPNGRFYARGLLGQYIIVLPDQDIVIVRLGEKRGQLVGDHLNEVLVMVEECIKMYGK